jgi:F-box-like
MADSTPADTNLSACPYLRLPPELLLRILEYSPPSSLKQLRSSCKALKTLADPLLWSTVYLYPHMDRFRQILSLSMHPPVRCHVRQLVYDLQWAQLLDHIVRRIKSVWSVHTSSEVKQAMVKRAWELKKGTMEPGRDDDIELLFLQDILRNLKSLESITVLENNASPIASGRRDLELIPTFYQKLRESTCGALPDTDLDPGLYYFRGSTRSTKRILVAAYSLEGMIKDLEIRNAHWEHVTAFEQDGKHISLLRNFIRGLKSLTLHGSFLGELPAAFLMTNLGMVLSLAMNLENLDLAFGVTRDDGPFSDGDWSTDDGHGSAPLTHSVLERLENGATLAGSPKKWGTGLKRLALSELRSAPSALTKIFTRCAPTLKDLELNDIDLLPEVEGDIDQDTKPCLVAFFDSIRSCLTLDRIWLSRSFHNCGRQEFTLNPHTIYDHEQALPPPSKFLIERLFQYIINAPSQPHNPLAPLAINFNHGATDLSDAQLDLADDIADPSFNIRTHFVPDEDSDADGVSIASGLSAEYALASVGVDVSSPMGSDPPPGRPGGSPVFGPETEIGFDWVPTSPVYRQLDEDEMGYGDEVGDVEWEL